ncbi:hypothetical protein GCM10009422_29980 [Brevundimonas kwangchunensis]|uniref:Glycine-rich domain-containing protein n=1 Tax=Brevundimonas kwangchunensis TaxID=322163 RepID=A0ABN1H6U2_9CAUL
MSDEHSARLKLPYLVAAQMQKHVTLNETLTRLDTLVQTSVVSRTLASEPGDPADGDIYILPAGATGESWDVMPDGALVRFEAGAWTASPVVEGMLALVSEEAQFIVRHNEGWVGLGETLSALDGLERLGIGTDADAGNPFTAKLNTALWTALETSSGGTGDLRLTLNKETAGDVLSLLFQSGWGGRAELGLVGDDDLVLKVSPDGGVWREALRVDSETGRVRFDLGAIRSETVRLTENASWTPPPWARIVEAVAVGGGGGGGCGAEGASGDRLGGGGGAGGAVASGRWSADRLSGGLTVVVGEAGAGGVSGGGEDGGDSLIRLGATAILTAFGGEGGRAGAAGGTGGSRSLVNNGGGGSSVSATAGSGDGLHRPEAPGAGGAGGGLSTAGVACAGGPGGEGGALTIVATAGIGGVDGGGWGGWDAPIPDLHWSGGGGGGGGASASSSGHPGGPAGRWGAGGGGGGAGVSSGGQGGAGAPGVVWLTAIG